MRVRLTSLWVFSCLLPLFADPPDQAWQLRLDGSSSIVLPLSPALDIGTSYTFQLWVYPERRTSGAVLIRKAIPDVDSDPYMAFQLQLDADGRPGWGQSRGVPGSQMSSIAGTALPLNAWSHLAATCDGSVMVLYLNGSEIKRQFSPGGPPPVNGLPIHLGTRINPSNAKYPGLQYNGFAGFLRQLTVWNRALTPAEIRASMAALPSGSEPGLVACYPLDDGPGETFREAGPGRLESATLLYRTSAKMMNGTVPMNNQYQPTWFRTAVWNARPFDWSAQTQVERQVNPSQLYPIDFDSDGDLDLIGAGRFYPGQPEPALTAYRNTGRGGFNDVTKAVLGEAPTDMRGAVRAVVADLNQDGRSDLFISDYGADYFCCQIGQGKARLFIQTSGGRLTDESDSRLPSDARQVWDIDGADINGDGNVDLVIARRNPNLDASYFAVTILMNDGSGRFREDSSRLPKGIVVGKGAAFVRLLDANGDGFPDLFIGANANGSGDTLLLNDGTGRFNDMRPGTFPPLQGGANCASHGVGIADLNGDGSQDLLIATECDRYTQGAYKVLLNTGHGTFTDATLQWLPDSLILAGAVPADAFPWAADFNLADINLDGRIDALVRMSDSISRLYLNNGRRLMEIKEFLPARESEDNPGMAVADFDSDGRPDIVIADRPATGANRIWVGLNRSDFPAPSSPPAQDPPAPAIGALSVLNEASMSTDALAPGTRVRIRGANLGPAQPVTFPESPGANPPTTLGGVTVTFDATPARLISVSSTELVAMAPFSLAGKWQSLVRVSYQGRISEPVPVVVHDANPQVYTTGPAQSTSIVTIWTADAWKVDGKTRIRITTPGQLKWGDRIAIRLTGLGQGTAPLSDDDAARERSFTPAVPLQVYLGSNSTGAPVLTPVSMTWAPGGLGGVVEVVVDLPASQPAGVWELFGVPSWRASRQLRWPFAGTGDSFTYYISDRSGISRTTSGTEPSVQSGFAQVVPTAGATAPSGMAIFNYSEKGVLISEAAVPAAPLLQAGRVYAEIAGPVDTGVAIANPNEQAASISFHYTDAAGANVLSGSTTVAANSQIAAFLDQAPFVSQLPAQGLAGVRTFTFTSSLPVGVTALRGYVNERGEFLITTLPVTAIGTGAAGVTGFPHFADGGGWTSAVVLVNPSDAAIAGTARFYSKGSATSAGGPITLTANGTSASSFSYTIPARSAFKIQTAGAGSTAQTGWVTVTPGNGSSAPSGLVVFSYQSGGVRVSEAGVPALPAGSAFRLYAESGGSSGRARPGAIQTGVAVSNPSSSNATATFELMNLDGTRTGLSGTMTVPATGQLATFLNQIPGLGAMPASFKGILRVSGPDLLVTGLRGRSNERGDFLITTTAPVAENGVPSAAAFVFPQVADGGGYSTQIVLFSGTAGQATNGTLQFRSQSGLPLVVGLR